MLLYVLERFYTLSFAVKKTEAKIKAVSNEMVESAAELDALLKDSDEDEGSGINPVSVPTSGNVAATKRSNKCGSAAEY